MKAIETHYKGYRFRSRLEARWAVFFDALEVEWEYEPQGYLLKDGTPYLPDFWLPSSNIWLEVKGRQPSEDEFRKAEQLWDYGTAVVLGVGEPYYGTLYVYDFDSTSSTGGNSWWGDEDNVYFTPYPGALMPNGIGTCLKVEVVNDLSSRVFYSESVRCVSSRYAGRRDIHGRGRGGLEWILYPAAKAARSARFEHGETP